MRILVTGAAGFIGAALARAASDAFVDRAASSGGASKATGPAPAELLLTDLRFDEQSAVTAPNVRRIAGDIADPQLLDRLFGDRLDVVFHLAGVVSGSAERDFALGRRINLDATLALLERCRAQSEAGSAGSPQSGKPIRFVYASSIAVFGAPLPRRIDDATAPVPTLSYGTHKRVCELLIDDYTRRGALDGRALRLAGVVVRPAQPNGALSAFNSDLIREPLAGREYVCPVGPEATLWITSLRTTVANLLRVAELDGASLGPQRAVTAPALAASVAEIVAALGRTEAEAARRVRFDPQPGLAAQFGAWPLDCGFERAAALGLGTDASLDALIRDHHLQTRKG